jgi:hypothetical protein
MTVFPLEKKTISLNKITIMLPPLDKQITITVLFFSVIILAVNVASLMYELRYDFIKVITHATVLSLLGVSLILVGCLFLKETWNKKIQVTLIFITFSAALLNNYSSLYGTGFFLIFVLLLHKYNFVQKNYRFKMMCIIGYYMLLIGISNIVNNVDTLVINRILVSVFFSVFILIIMELIISDISTPPNFDNYRIKEKLINRLDKS